MFLSVDDPDVLMMRQLVDAGAAEQLAELLAQRPDLATPPGRPGTPTWAAALSDSPGN